jgi:arylsulfatase A-like enzyme
MHLALALSLLAIAPAPAVSSHSAPSGDPSGDPRPNVLFLFADDQRPDAVGAFGNEHIRTLHLDTIARRGFRFSSNYCMGSIHGAVCQPSRAMLMTGRTLYRVPMDLKDTPTLPELLGQAGYATFGTGKWHNGGDSFLRSFQRGRSVMLGGMSDHTKVPIVDVDDAHQFTAKREGERFSSELFADAAIDFLEGHGGEQPFFLYVAFTAPHDPRQPPEAYREHYYANRPPLPPNFMPQHPFHNGWMVGRDEALAAWPRTEQVVSDQLAEYYGLITHMDEQIGRVLNTLEHSGHADDTIVVFAADHGLAVGSHGLLGKQSVYEHSMGCPLLFAGPGIPRGQSAALTYLYDIFPTLCGLTGLTAPEGVEGRDLAPVWSGERARVRDTLFLTYEDKMRAVRDDRYKLIRYPLIDHVQLFDLAEDPHELHDLAGEPAQAPRVATMTGWLADWQTRVDDPHPLTVETPKPMELDLTGRARKPDRWQPAWIVEKYFGGE